MKQTAVEWLIGQIKGYESDCEIFQIAKQMEKEQIIDFFKEGYDAGFYHSGIDAEEYYNETFKSK